MKDTISIRTKDKEYKVFIDQSYTDPDSFRAIKDISPSKLFIITNETVAPLYLKKISSILKLRVPGIEIEQIVLPDGEEYKKIETIQNIYSSLLDKYIDRSSVIIALGGGVIGDMAGFGASTVMRGIKFINIPTTLLAMVDSSIGGKTGFNHMKGKNLIGTFYQPEQVYIYTDFLDTLKDNEYRSGISEIIKYGLIKKPDIINFISDNIEKISKKEHNALFRLIYESVKIKGEIVEQDEKERSLRMILNFGHTLGHALEAATDYQKFTHGDAVSIGMIFSLILSKNEKITDKYIDKIINLALKTGLPVKPDISIKFSKINKFIMYDKKNIMKKNRFILLEEPGRTVISENIEYEKLDAAWEELVSLRV
ncbi:MAG: 3-dehydroquinate synthase [Actinomycetia bacterium]|nr:3-dehydroquinate synthase [Actinomycetes bacterium]